MKRQLSKRISSLAPSPTLALNSKAVALAKAGRKIYNFAVGEPDFPTPETVVAVAIDSLQKGRTRYGPAGGSINLREAIRSKLKRDNNLDFETDEIVCGIGAKEILFHLFLTLLNDGDEVLLPAPYWVSYTDQIRAAGGIPVVVPAPAELSNPVAPKINHDALEKLVTANTKAIVINTPNNPAGYVLTPSDLQNLADFALRHDLWLISDEIYEYMAFEQPHQSLLSLRPDLRDRFILVNGLSKGFAMTGWRVGYAAGPQPVIRLVRNLESHSSTCIPTFIDDAATFALSKGRALMAPMIASLNERRLSSMQLLDGMDYIHPQGAFYLFIDVRKQCTVDRSSMDLSTRLLDEEGVAVVPGEAFGMPGFLRISYVLPESDLRDGLARIKNFLTRASTDANT